jgi:hypothetical protein
MVSAMQFAKTLSSVSKKCGNASCEVLYVLGIKVIIDTTKFDAMSYYGDIYV